MGVKVRRPKGHTSCGMEAVEPQKPTLPTLAEYSHVWLAEVELARKPAPRDFTGSTYAFTFFRDLVQPLSI